MLCSRMSISWQTSINTVIGRAIVPSNPPSSSLTLSVPECYRCRCSIAGAGHLETQKLQDAEPKPMRTASSVSGSPSPRGADLPEERKSISEIKVPRQKYIPVPKADLLDALLSMLRSQQLDDASLIPHFLLLSSCLDSILHAEHKSILEEMRADYSLTQSVKRKQRVPIRPGKGSAPVDNFGVTDSSENGSVETHSNNFPESENPVPFYYHADLMRILGLYTDNMLSNADDDYSLNRLAAATRFQRSFMKLLKGAQFEELSVRDLMLTSSLNTDYLLTLPIYVDWRKASESNAIIFRRGYATEKQKGLLIVEKLDYLQSKLLQEVFSLISKPLQKIGHGINKVLESISKEEEIQVWMKRVKLWVDNSSLFQPSFPYKDQSSNDMSDNGQELDSDLPIWLAAQRAVSRYEGFLSSVGPRGRLLRKFLTWVGLIAPTPETPFELDVDNTATSEPYLRPVFLSRISLGDIWRPATRKYCNNNIWRMLKTAVSIIFSRSVLQEPAFRELILLYTEETGEISTRDTTEIPSLQLKIYEKIPIPDLQVIFPHKKLSFRILDAVRLDIATLLGLLAFLINYKFEDVLYSPSAFLLDVISVSALIIYVTRVALGYKQTRDRYQLLVNRALYEKTIASGFGSVYFLLDASEQQQYKECILAYAILLNAGNNQVSCRSTLAVECERFLYDVFDEKVEMPVNEAVDALKKFGLVTEETINGKPVLQVVPCSTAHAALKKQWDHLLS